MADAIDKDLGGFDRYPNNKGSGSLYQETTEESQISEV